MRIPTLDGWRGIAILLVLIEHFSPFSEQRYPWLVTGPHGVAIFFVLSGYLITTRLMEERAATGSIDLKTFYVRRFFRLMPAAWTFLAFLVVLQGISHEQLLACLFFYRNYLPTGGLPSGHFWSLSIEEQFYLVWPAVLLFAWKRSTKVALAAAGAIALYRLCAWSHFAALPFGYAFRTELHADALLVGCAAALLRRRFPPWTLPILFALLGSFLLSYHRLVPISESMVIAALLVSCQHIHALEWKPLAAVGRVSYGIYLWQQPFVPAIDHHPARLPLLLLLPLVVLASYYLIERPAIRLGHRLLTRRIAAPQPA